MPNDKDIVLNIFKKHVKIDLHEFECENEMRANIMDDLKNKDVQQNMKDHESRMERKHCDLVNEIIKWSQSIVNI